MAPKKKSSKMSNMWAIARSVDGSWNVVGGRLYSDVNEAAAAISPLWADFDLHEGPQDLRPKLVELTLDLHEPRE